MKGYNEEFRFEDGVLYIRLTGKFPDELLLREGNLFQPLIEACSAQNCGKALIDARDLEVDLDTTELFRAGKDAASLTRFSICIALVAREEMISTFFENVVVNRGGNVGIFTDIDAARDWLHR